MEDDQYSSEEAARRRDEVIRRMANTPPQHRKAKVHSHQKAKTTGARRVRRGARAKS